MITEEYGKYVLICDICGEEIGGFDQWEDALEYKNEEGWQSKQGERLDLKDGWIDICTICGGRK